MPLKRAGLSITPFSDKFKTSSNSKLNGIAFAFTFYYTYIKTGYDKIIVISILLFIFSVELIKFYHIKGRQIFVILLYSFIF